MTDVFYIILISLFGFIELCAAHSAGISGFVTDSKSDAPSFSLKIYDVSAG